MAQQELARSVAAAARRSAERKGITMPKRIGISGTFGEEISFSYARNDVRDLIRAAAAQKGLKEIDLAAEFQRRLAHIEKKRAARN